MRPKALTISTPAPPPPPPPLESLMKLADPDWHGTPDDLLPPPPPPAPPVGVRNSPSIRVTLNWSTVNPEKSLLGSASLVSSGPAAPPFSGAPLLMPPPPVPRIWTKIVGLPIVLPSL